MLRGVVALQHQLDFWLRGPRRPRTSAAPVIRWRAVAILRPELVLTGEHTGNYPQVSEAVRLECLVLARRGCQVGGWDLVLYSPEGVQVCRRYIRILHDHSGRPRAVLF